MGDRERATRCDGTGSLQIHLAVWQGQAVCVRVLV